MTARSQTLEEIRKAHILIEHHFQNLAMENPSPCATCTSICCKEAICRESVGSDFLRFILGSKVSEYDEKDGWLSRTSGCTLEFGRPLICYEFFCSQFSFDAKVLKLQKLSSEFKKLYANVHRRQHVLEIDDLNSVPEEKWEILLNKLREFRAKNEM